MSEKDYYSRETIDAKLGLIHQLCKENCDTAARIETLATSTNGKVKKHEKIFWFVWGALAIIGLMGAPNFMWLAKLLGTVI